MYSVVGYGSVVGLDLHMKRILFIVTLVGLLVVLAAVPASAQPRPLPMPDAPTRLTNEWAVILEPGADPDQAAAQLGMVNLGQVGSLENIYRFAYPADIRTARTDITAALTDAPQVAVAIQQEARERVLRGVEDDITDPLFPNQWHLRSSAQNGANVFPAWNAGYTGEGIVVASVDDGVWHAHPDIAPNYRADLSYDYFGNDPDPSAGGHGTAVAGVMAAAADGGQCGVGAAFDAEISGVRLNLSSATDAQEASAISHRNDGIHVYNNSWGPTDNGRIVEGPGMLTEAALLDNISSGRGGLGAITVWAAGNGGLNDNVNADGYANHRTVIAVGATTNTGVRSWYGEPGAPILVNAPSDGGSQGITTTGYSASTCTNAFGGTSSAAPLVAGVVALMLEANPSLTWRDVKQILAESAMQNDPASPLWQTNAAGHLFHPYYGLGRVDAAAAVTLAAAWDNLPAELNASSPVTVVNTPLPDATPGSGAGIPGAWVSSTVNIGDPLQLEHVEITLNATHLYRGDVEVELISPSGTVSRLMYGRATDNGQNYVNWRMSSTHFWGEPANGVWTLRLRDVARTITGSFDNWQLRVYGHVPSLKITGTAAPVSVFYGQTADLNVSAVGPNPISYQWYEGVSGDTSTPVGADSPSFNTGALTANTSYWVRVADGVTTLDSATYTVTVETSRSLMASNADDNILPFSWINPSGERLLCTNPAKAYSPNCVLRFKGSPGEASRLAARFTMSSYPELPLDTSHVWRISGQVKAAPGAQVNIIVRYRYSDPLAWHDEYVMPLTETSGWQPFEMVVPIPRSDVEFIRVILRNRTQTSALLWIDDLDVRYSADEPASRGALSLPSDRGGVLLLLPAAPDSSN